MLGSYSVQCAATAVCLASAAALAWRIGNCWHSDKARASNRAVNPLPSPAHIARAALEAIALQSADVLNAMSQDAGVRLQELRADGGASANNLLMQMQADSSGVPVERSVLTETTALGAAYLAGLAVGFWSGTDEIASQWQVDRSL